MTHYGGGAAAAGTAAAAAAEIQALKASGAIVKIEPAEFKKILDKIEEPLVVYAEGGLFTKNYQYLMNYKGLFFFTKATEPIHLSGRTEIVAAKSIWVP